MEIKEAFIRSTMEVFPIFKLKPQFQHEEEKSLLTATDQVNILISFTHTLKGNIVFGLDKNAALKVASAMTGREVQILDQEAKNVLEEIANMIVSLAIGKHQVVSSIYFSSPLLITGDNMSLLLSRVKATKLIFQLKENYISLAYCIQ
jgi:CheY-specific phosphatase CheX